ncbi:MAG: N-acetyl-gamma-glutamyl-phosphate reductase [Planctomycetes bacterium]|nr:N-acetyl-gamma-glutamyl-phosphate reductase [Planctomycetota bacterium]
MQPDAVQTQNKPFECRVILRRFSWSAVSVMVRVAIVGASGYTGAESVEILLGHPQAELTYLTGRQHCGPLSDLFGRFKGRVPIDVEPLDLSMLADRADVVFCCLPHTTSMACVPQLLAAGCKVIDFSADYRLRDAAVYEQTYDVKHADPANLPKAVYGLPELYRDQIRQTDLVANPGCFPTAAILAVAPLLKHRRVRTDTLIVNAVTGISGAGKKPTAAFHFPNMNENLFAYGVGNHRHTPEIEQIVSDVAGQKVDVLFQPHAGPFDRGIFSTLYLEPRGEVTSEQLFELFESFYRDEPFVQICRASPNLKDVTKTNYCQLFPTVAKGKVVVFAAIDNMVKGAAGQAVQNMNILFGLDETLGLL